MALEVMVGDFAIWKKSLEGKFGYPYAGQKDVSSSTSSRTLSGFDFRPRLRDK